MEFRIFSGMDDEEYRAMVIGESRLASWLWAASSWMTVDQPYDSSGAENMAAEFMWSGLQESLGRRAERGDFGV